MLSLETYLQRADELAQEIIGAWNRPASTDFTPEFTSLLHKTFLYITARETQKLRAFGICRIDDSAEERTTRLAFARAYKTYVERRAATLN